MNNEQGARNDKVAKNFQCSITLNVQQLRVSIIKENGNPFEFRNSLFNIRYFSRC